MSWLDRFFSNGYASIQVAGVPLSPETAINFVNGAIAVDNPASARTDVSVIPPLVAHGNTGAAMTLDFTAGPNHSAVVNSNTVLTFTAPNVARHLMVEFSFSGGSHTITWPATVKWNGGVQPTWDTSGNQNVATFFWDGTSYLGMGSSFS